MIITIGMALIAFGVVVSGLFFAGVYMLAIGMVTTATGAILRLFGAPAP
jgi:hypothetical protein